MSEQPGYSPSFKRPSDTLRLRRKRARSEGVGSGRPHSNTRLGISLPGVRPYSPGPSLNGQPRSGGVKRRNPFASLENTHSSPKRRAAAPRGRDADFLGCKLFNAAEGGKTVQDPARQGALLLSEGTLHAEDRSRDAPKEEQTSVSVSEDDSLFEDDLFSEEKISPSILTNPQGSDSSEVAPPLCTEYPADWSLKTRLLFTSPLSFSWAEHLKAQEEAQGLSQHCRAAHIPLPQNIQDTGSSWELRCCLSQALQFWQHPSLPWLQLFPRMNAERSFSGKSAPWSLDPLLQQSLRNEWAGSLTSLYSLLKARLCPYFYVCCYQFTVLFRASGFSGTGDITAVLSPTTRGLREAMRTEGIEFTLPLLAAKRKCRGCSSIQQQHGEHILEPREAAEDEDGDEGEEVCGEGGDEDEEDDEDGGLSWLREMGVEGKIQQPDSISIRLRKELTELRSDRRAESMVVVRGSAHTFMLLNFLINSRSVVATAGSQSGLPPTLLSPTPFRGATLHTLRARSVKVKTRVGSGFQDVSSLEVTGPVLPHALHALTLLLRPAQRGNFSTTLYPHEPTAVFNTPVGPETTALAQDAAAQGLEGCGLNPSTVQQLLQPSALGQGALRQLHLREYCYSWRS